MEFEFAVTVTITKGEEFRAFERRRQESLVRIARELAEYHPVREESYVALKAEDYGFGFALLDRLKEAGYPGVMVADDTIWDLSDLFRARYVVLFPKGSTIECDPQWRSMNRYPKVLCKECGWYDLSVVEGAFKVWGPHLRRDQEIYPGGHRRLVMTQRVLELFRRVVEDQIEWGPVEVVERAPPDCDANLFFVLPKHTTGRCLNSYYEEACPACAVPISCCSSPAHGAIGRRLTVEGYQDSRWNVAASPSWFGGRRGGGPVFSLLHWVLGAGELLAYLLANNAKGLLIPEGGVFSSLREPLFEAQRRLPELLPDKVLESTIRKFKRRARVPTG